MEQILIISGKGGAGKTIFASALAPIIKNKVLADCDVDAANLHILLEPNIKERYEFVGGKVPEFSLEKCTACGKCVKLCKFEALSTVEESKGQKPSFDEFACEGCGVCVWNCPADAIKMEDEIAGEWFISETRYANLVHAKLGAARENSGKLVSIVRMNAYNLANRIEADYLLIDGPPGIGCPVISSITGIDKVIIVTEPTVSGIHDMNRVYELTEHFKIEKIYCVINKFDINLSNTQKIEDFCVQKGIRVAGKLPFDKEIVKLMANKRIITEDLKDHPFSVEMRKIWEVVQSDKILE